MRTVPSDFLEQDVQTDTQAHRIERETESKLKKAQADANLAKKKAASKARKADSWITNHLASLSEDASNALVLTNIAAVIGISGFLGFKAYRLYDVGQLNWRAAGIGAGVLGAVAVFEGVFGRYVLLFRLHQYQNDYMGYKANSKYSYFYKARGRD